MLFRSMDSVSGEINSQEFNDTVTIWNHYIKMENIGGGQVKYTDTVDLFAGKLTTLIALWSLRFYKHRQHKWIKILSEKNNHK